MIRRRERGGYYRRGITNLKSGIEDAARLIERGRLCEQKQDWLAAKLMYERAKQCAADAKQKAFIAWRIEFLVKHMARLNIISEPVYE